MRKPTAVTSSELGPVTAIAAGDLHTCAIGAPDRLWCWGSSSQGQIGEGSLARSWQPKTVLASTAAPLAAKQLSAGGNHSCALAVDGTGWCWGYNANGQVGVPSPVSQALAVSVGKAFASVRAAGLHTCAIGKESPPLAWGWGANWANQLGPLASGEVTAPAQLQGSELSGVLELAGGHDHSCARLPGGVVKCWGSNSSGQLGNKTTNDSATPVQAIGSGATAIAAQGVGSCAIASGAVSCWGRIGPSTSLSPAAVQGLPGPASAVSVGGYHACAVSGGTVYCWGSSWLGQLGHGSTADSPGAVAVAGGPSDAAEVSCGWMHSCARSSASKEIWCWGSNSSEQLGMAGPPRLKAEKVAGLADAVAAGWSHTCALSGQQVLCWGEQTFGQLGDGATSRTTSPRRILPP
jgi:alpha-tubulin suppressor-like RCC1 family protein